MCAIILKFSIFSVKLTPCNGLVTLLYIVNLRNLQTEGVTEAEARYVDTKAEAEVYLLKLSIL